MIMHKNVISTAPCPSTSPLRVSSSLQQGTILRYTSSNYTIILNGNETLNLHINVTFEPNTPLYLLEWMQNGYIIKTVERARIEISGNGSLTVNEVQPSDAGRYVVSVSSDMGCGSAAFNIEVQC